MEKMKWIGVLIIVVALFGWLFIFMKSFKPPVDEATSLPTSSVTSTPSAVSYCTDNDLSASASFEAAAGNIYGTLTITNISNNDCVITLGNSIKAKYTANNITVAYKSSDPNTMYTLASHAKVYSQVHYPNGPQCQSAILPQPVTLSYEVNNVKVNFESFNVSACVGSENTQIDIWPISINPLR